MGFLIGEIIAFLAGAALIGLFIGWALFGGKKAAAPAVAGVGVSGEALKKLEGRAKDLEAERDGVSRSLVERDDEIARLRHQIAQNEQHRIESANRVEQFKTQVDVLQERLRTRDADLAVAGAGGLTPGTGLALAELTQQLRERDAELQKLQLRYDGLAGAAGPDAPTVAELKAQIAELRATLETGGQIGDEGEQVVRLMEQNAKLSEENLGLKAAYEAAERSLEEQDGAMDQLSQVLLKSQQEAAGLKQDFAALKAQSGRSTELGIIFPPPLPRTTTVAPLAVAEAAEEDEATRAISAFDLPDDDVPPPLPPLPPLAPPIAPPPAAKPAPPVAPAAAVGAALEEATMALAAFDEDTEVDTASAPAPAAPQWAAAASPRDDDLKRIKGIGPAIEKRIKEAGIASWAQLAALDAAALEALAEDIKVSPEKIKKDAWVEQARDLQANG